MHRSALSLIAASLLSITPSTWAASITLRYHLDPGATYEVTQLDHDKGESLSEFAMPGGTPQTHKSPFDRISKSRWSMTVTKADKSGMQLAVAYGQQQGQERMASPTTDATAIFGNSEAQVHLDPLDGMVEVKTTPDDDMTRMLYTSRFIWLPALPQQSIKVDDDFTHEYHYRDNMMAWKGEDEYVLDEIDGPLAYFSVESKLVAKYEFKAPDMGASGNNQGMATIPSMGAMTYVYQGKGSAVFDTRLGMFIEWETKSAYNIPTTSIAGMKTSMRGVRQMRWELSKL